VQASGQSDSVSHRESSAELRTVAVDKLAEQKDQFAYIRLRERVTDDFPKEREKVARASREEDQKRRSAGKTTIAEGKALPV
jgi:hypothetical protein